uniref:ABC-type xenobiotic transporter n=1 Tax=Plectus sambesii TaxID=2011161 RepID=A0A914UWH6_9BILA
MENVEQKFIECASTPFVDRELFSLSKTLLRAFGCQYFSLGIVRFIGDSLSFAGPILLHLLITFMQDPAAPIRNGYFYAFGIFAATLLAAICSMHFAYYVSRVGLKIKSAIITALYEKLLKVSTAELGENGFSMGQIANFMSTDVDRVVNFCGSFHAFWALPMQLVIALYLLYREVELAFLAGVICAVILVPINKYITLKIGDMSTHMMHWKDRRVRLITELMFGIRVVKLSNWERHFEEKIGQLRAKELYYLRARKYLDALCVYMWASAPILITVSIFVTYSTLMNQQLTAAKVFTSLALVNILIQPLNAFPWVLNGLVEAYVSMKRLNRFFAQPDIDYRRLYVAQTATNDSMYARSAQFSWVANRVSRPAVDNLTLACSSGSVIGVIGTVGSGKSSLLQGLLGETHCLSGGIQIEQVSLSRGFAYVAQSSWLQRGTVRENILFGQDYDPEFYKQVIYATALESDIQQMPNGDMCELSDQGVTLSGGQRARIALARAVYQNKDIYLLDDPLAAVDAKVGRHIWDHCIDRMLRQRGKTVIIATHHIGYLWTADFVIRLSEDGTISAEGPPIVVLPPDSKLKDEEADSVRDSGEFGMSVDSGEPILVLRDEDKAVGTVGMGIYGAYLKAVGICLSILIVLSLLLMQSTKNGTDWWLSYWVEHIKNSTNGSSSSLSSNYLFLAEHRYPFSLYTSAQASKLSALDDDDSDDTAFYLYVYGGLAFANTMFTLARAFLFAYGGIVAAKNLHQKLVKTLLKARVRWWDGTPAGRVVNRLSSDVYTADDSLPFQANICLASLFNLFGALVLTLYALPLFAPAAAIAVVLYYFIQRYYRFTTCEVKRLTSVSLSPLYSHLTDTVAGLATIRAFRSSESHLTDTVAGLATIRAFRSSERFMYLLRSKLTTHLRAQFTNLACSQWLAVRLQMLAVVMVTAVALAAVLQHHFMNRVDAGLVGLAISYALSLTGLLNNLLSSFTETEKELVSVERIAEYTANVPSEPVDGHYPFASKADISGRIQFAAVSLRYDVGLPFALNNVSFVIEPGQKVGVVGRTGSGKSSLFQALLRGVEVEFGRIFLDSVDIATMNLSHLRSLFAVIPQNPFLFTGTLSENLCMDQKFEREELEVIVRQCKLDSLLLRLGGFEGKIEEMGCNLSAGERQLVCIARALLRQPKIVLIDEATAHVDSETDVSVQSLLRSALPNCTVITIAHRLNTLLDYDRVIVLDRAHLVAIGPPAETLGLV